MANGRKLSPPLKTVAGGRVSVRQRRTTRLVRILLLPGTSAVNLDNGYEMVTTKPIELSIPDDAVVYSSVDFT